MATVSSSETNREIDEWTKPPFLRRVRIRGYKSIAFCDVSLQPLTILVGRNAAGKSNFLDALVFLGDIVKLGVNEAIKRHGGSDVILCRMCKDRIVSIEIECCYATADDSTPWNATYRVDVEFLKKRPAKVRQEELRIEKDKWWVGYTNSNGRVTCGAADDQPQNRVWRVKDRPFLDAYHDTPVPEFSECLETLIAYNFHPEAIRRLQKPNPGWFLERDGSNLASVIETTREIEEETIERVGRYLSVVTESVELLGGVQYGDYETVRFRVPRNGEGQPLEFDAASMSDGTLRVLGALVAAFQVVLPHGYPSLVGIEEPETSLHPAAMRALVDALDEATQRTQILLTTHSADLLSGRDVTPGQVLVVRNRGGQTHVTPVDPASREIIEKELYSLADLQRMDRLDLDEADLKRQARLSNGTEGT